MNKRRFKAELKKIVKQIIERYQPKKIILFGSATSGKYKKDSDVDLLIIKESKKRRVDRIGEILNLVERQIPLDPLVYTPSEFEERLKMGDFFLKEVLDTGKIVYEET